MKHRIERRRFDRPCFDAAAVAAVLLSAAANRDRDAKFNRDPAHRPNSYGNGRADGAALAEATMLQLALKHGGSVLPLIEAAFPGERTSLIGLSERQLYRQGLIVGYFEILSRWAAAGTGIGRFDSRLDSGE